MTFFIPEKLEIVKTDIVTCSNCRQVKINEQMIKVTKEQRIKTDNEDINFYCFECTRKKSKKAIELYDETIKQYKVNIDVLKNLDGKIKTKFEFINDKKK